MTPELFSASSLDLAFSSMGLLCRDGLFAELATAYASPGRAYHNCSHIANCLSLLAETHALCEHPHQLALAIWFHDAVYDTRASDNEARSAAWANRELRLAGAGRDVFERVSRLIMVTKDHMPTSAEEELMVDIDLTILGSSPETFAAYDQAIRAEYDWVPETLYQSGRARVLQGFLKRPRIYSTECFHSRYEERARENLAWIIRALRRESA